LENLSAKQDQILERFQNRRRVLSEKKMKKKPRKRLTVGDTPIHPSGLFLTRFGCHRLEGDVVDGDRD
jgi:hypothetical protein